MTKWKSFKTLLGAGVFAAFGLVTGCEQAEQKQQNFEILTEKVQEQLTHDVLGEANAIDYLEQAPIEARAMSGSIVTASVVPEQSLEEALKTESYFVIGSVIAKPKESLTTVVEEEMPASSQLPEAEETQVAEAIVTESEFAAIEQAVPDVVRSLKPNEMSKNNGQIRLSNDARTQVKRAMHANRNMERIENFETRESVLKKLEPPREAVQKIQKFKRDVRVRKELNQVAALDARSKALKRLENMGLSGAAYARDGGNMVINIGMDPTGYQRDDKPRLNEKFKRFAPHKLKSEDKIQDCSKDSTRTAMRSDAELATRCVVEDLRASGDYEYVEPDYIFTNQFEIRPKNLPVTPITTSSGLNPNDPLWGFQWHFKNQGTGEDESEGGAGFANFWSRANQTGSAGVTVAVIDTGLQMDHPDIKSSRNLAPGFDMVSDPFMGNDGDGRDSDPNDPGDACDPTDPLAQDTFHGTHVAGTVGAASTDNSSGVAGGAWNVTIVPVRALGRCGGQLSDINDAIRWAAGVVPARDDLGDEIWNANPADIINLSIGLFESCPASMQEAINDATDAGVVVVAAAGNARIDTKYYAPGGCQNVVSVAASDARGMLTPYSNYGEAVDILAPGGDLTRDDNGDGRPDGVLSTKYAKNCYDPVTNEPVESCYYAYESGTSMAAPHVSAALALIKSQFPLATSEELTSRLKSATNSRSQLQCSGKCTHYPGSEPIPGQEGMCFRPCGGVALDLANAQLD
ncbi:S8 family serine peptidase [Hirschia baltica]|uniref:Peptidase S8 and S53 subtilisin kexin sedolisin n=1 Tax=Hirschia baltica (strain ATCC 49814 / DSM 5838 / IFAM 1418) TaxID=582402 RepID=C6XKE6_HIRBI|nr:S8 family serine peptidase [Hirschia baltica]ACT57744.1 peptidase S8 and S53 subtilisin kexin sedolisin [Hirschia baltica ATCC 49814]